LTNPAKSAALTGLSCVLDVGIHPLAAVIGASIMPSLALAGGGLASLCSVAALWAAYYILPGLIIAATTAYLLKNTNGRGAQFGISFLGVLITFASHLGCIWAASATLGQAFLPNLLAPLIGTLTVFGSALGLAILVRIVAGIAANIVGSAIENPSNTPVKAH
jgi:hypothetical protein